jgi:signal transduction histidine kinase
MLHRNALRLLKLVNGLLDFVRIEVGKLRASFEATDLAQFTAQLASVVRSAVERAGLQLVVDCAPLPELVYVDREMWEKIVLNLLSNALKFTFAGGVRVAIKPADGGVALTVADSGIGIPESELRHIFERFHRVPGAKGRSIEGTGIGLALVQELVKLHGGSIQAESELSRGTTFTVTIPFGSDHLPKDQVCEPGNSASSVPRPDGYVGEALRWLPDGAGAVNGHSREARHSETKLERVLLADDNADMREYVARLLGEHYRVESVANGDEALRCALADPPDLILSDVMMPGLDGFGLLTELRARPETRTIPIVLLSARAGEESQVEGLGAGADDYLIKPFTARELLARVAAQLSMRRRRMEAEAEVKESRATLQSFYDSSPFLMGVIELDGDRIIPTYCNNATAEFLGTDIDRLQTQTSVDLGIPAAVDAIWVDHFRQCQAENRPVHFEYEHPGRNGAVWLDCCLNPLGIGPGGRPRVSYFAEDVTDRVKSDELLRRSNQELRRANADLEQFAYSASHDLQEPLRQVAVYSQLLAKKFSDKFDGKGAQYLSFCVEGARHMEMLIKGLLDYSQVTRSSNSGTEPVAVSTREVLETVTKHLATAIAETGAIIIVGELPMVHGDPAPLVHLFQNLVSNALKYRSKTKPSVTIAAVEDSG